MNYVLVLLMSNYWTLRCNTIKHPSGDTSRAQVSEPIGSLCMIVGLAARAGTRCKGVSEKIRNAKL